MKKIIVILLLIAYGVSSFGATIHEHYCMNKLVSSSLDNKIGGCGSKSMMGEMQKGKCCKHTFKQVKVENHYKDALAGMSYEKFISAAIPSYYYLATTENILSTTNNTYFKQAFRRKTNNKIYILDCVYRI
jgi:hypothetical protein